jgi:hypothetical protein
MCHEEQIKLTSLPEIARRAQVCVMTARRYFAAHNIEPDAILVVTGRKPPVQLFFESRANGLAKLISSTPKIIS